MLTSPEAAVHIGKIYARFNISYLSHSLIDMKSIAQWLECAIISV